MNKAVEAFLSEYRKTQNYISYLSAKITETKKYIEAEYEAALKIQELKHDKVKGGNSIDRTSATVAKIIDTYNKRIENWNEYKRKAKGKLILIEDTVEAAGLSDEEKKCIKFMYFEGLKPRQVAAKIGYSVSRERDFRRGALSKISKVI